MCDSADSQFGSSTSTPQGWIPSIRAAYHGNAICATWKASRNSRTHHPSRGSFWVFGKDCIAAVLAPCAGHGGLPNTIPDTRHPWMCLRNSYASGPTPTVHCQNMLGSILHMPAKRHCFSNALWQNTTQHCGCFPRTIRASLFHRQHCCASTWPNGSAQPHRPSATITCSEYKDSTTRGNGCTPSGNAGM